MKKFKRSIVKSEDLIVDDHIKVGGLLYRIDMILPGPIDTSVVYAHNVRRPRVRIIITFEKNTLLHIWNQK